MKVRFLGSGDSFGSGGRGQACILVESESTRFLLDCGASSLIAMKREKVDPASIETIFVSHFHGDHFGGIPFFILDAQFVSPRAGPLTIAGPPGVQERVVGAMEALFAGSSGTKQAFDIRFLELAGGERTQVGGLAVSAHHVAHAGGSTPLGYRVEADGRALAYSGDTEWTEALVELADGADLFICECYTFDKVVPFHLDYETLRRNRARLNCKRLVLTHAGSALLERLQDVETEVADDGTVIEL